MLSDLNRSPVLVFSKKEFIGWVERLYDYRGVPLRGVVSIGDPCSTPPTGLDGVACPVLRLEFLDRYDTGAAQSKIGPCSTHIVALSNFAALLQQREGTTVVHCDAGVSRGPSVGWLLACFLAGPGGEHLHLNVIRSQRPGMALNPWLITLAQRRFRSFDFATPAMTELARNGVQR